MIISVFRQIEKDVFIQYTDVDEEVKQYLLRLHLVKSKIPDNLVKNHNGITLGALYTSQF